MTGLVTAIYAACGLIVGIHLTLLVGGLRVRIRDRRLNAAARAERGDPVRVSVPTRVSVPMAVSVIVAARDEQHSLPVLLESLERQGVADFEVVLVSDRSTDDTVAVMQDFARRRVGTVVVDNTEEPVRCNGKQQALDLGVAAAGGDLLMFTDADCELPAAWVSEHAARFSDPNVAAVFGALSVRADDTLLARYQAYDQALVHQYSTGTAGIGVPTGCFGNNLAVRSGALGAVGGFRALGFSPTEDAALLAALQRRGLRVQPTASPRSAIVTAPQTSWREFLHQHIRWNSGAFYGDGLVGRWSYRYVVLFLIGSIVLVPLARWWPVLALFPITSFTTITLLGALAAGSLRRGVVAAGGRLSGFGLGIRVLAYTVLFMGFYALATAMAVAGVRPRWKGQRLQRARASREG